MPSVMRLVRNADFAARLERQSEEVRARFGQRDVALDALRAVNTFLDPGKVAAWLVQQAQGAIPAPCWAVVTTDSPQDIDGELGLLAEGGLLPALGPAMWGA